MERPVPLSEKHPSADSLHAFGLGRLGGADSAAIKTHVDVCAECRRIVAEAAHERSSAVALDTLSQAPASGPGKPSATLPPELANHPDYRIVRELGRGGMGVVYLAHNTLMGRDEVLKVAQKSLLEDPEVGPRFMQEIRSAAQLVHPNVVRAYSVLRLGELLVFAMEYVPGDDLGKILRERGPLPVGEACRVALQAARGLEHAHQKGMVHRDIKPSNLIIAKDASDESTVKILDFGLAKITSERNQSTGLTAANKMLGTPDYIAPEQISDAAAADIRADIYSLGCTLHCLLAGKPPFAGKSLYDVLHAHCSSTAKSLDLVRVDVPVELAKTVSRMMEKDPAKRFRTPAEVVDALAQFDDAVGASAPSRAAGSAPPRSPNAWRPGGRSARRRARWVVPVAVLVGVALLAAGAIALSGVLRVQTSDGVIVLEKVPDGAEVFVNGNQVTIKSGGSATEIRTVPGKHKLVIRRPGFHVFRRDIDVDVGATVPVQVRLDSLAPPAAVVAPNKKSLSDLLAAGSVWSGTFSQTADTSTIRVDHELHVTTRDRATLKGFSLVRGTDRAQVLGHVDGDSVAWTETDPVSGALTTVSGRLDDDALRVTFERNFRDGSSVRGAGVLRLGAATAMQK
jgi:hypothetical protein